MPTFRATLELHGKTATGIAVPDSVVAELVAGKKPAVTVTLGASYSFRTTVAPRGGRYLVPVSADHRTQAGVAAGDELDVRIELDTAPRVVVVPPALLAALTAQPGVLAHFTTLSYSRQLGYALAVEGAKTDQTRDRRIASVLADLGHEPGPLGTQRPPHGH